MFEFLQEFTQFDDSIHAVFKDQSSMIIHYNGSLTYFDNKGQSNRLKIANCRKYDNTYTKMMETLKLGLRFTPLIPDVLEYEEAIKMKKITSFIWPMEGSQEQNSLILHSYDHHATIKMSLENYQIQITYYSCKEPVAVLKENESDYVNDFIKKYNLNKGKSNINCQIGYTYRKITKVFTLLNLPQQWQAPVYVLLRNNLTLELISKYLNISPEIMEYIDSDNGDDEHFQEQYGFYKVKDQLITLVKESNEKQKVANDTIPPTTNKISQLHLGKPMMMVSGQSEFWFAENGGFGICEDKLLLRDGIFWELGNQKWEQSIYNDKYQLNNLDIMCRYSQSRKQNRNSGETQQCLKTIKYQIQSLNFDVQREVDIINVGHFILYKNGGVRGRFMDRTIVTLKYPPPLEIKIINSQGYSNIIDFKPEINQQYFQNSKYLLEYIPEQYQYYLSYCLNLAEESFTNIEIQQQRQEYARELHSWINSEMESNNRFLILTGKVPINKDQIEQEMEIIDEEDMQSKIAQLLHLNNLMIDSLNTI